MKNTIYLRIENAILPTLDFKEPKKIGLTNRPQSVDKMHFLKKCN